MLSWSDPVIGGDSSVRGNVAAPINRSRAMGFIDDNQLTGPEGLHLPRRGDRARMVREDIGSRIASLLGDANRLIHVQ